MNRRKSTALLLSIALHISAFYLLWLFLHKAEEKTATASSAKRVDISLSDFIPPPPASPVVPKKSTPTPKASPKPKTQNQRPKSVKKPETEPAAKPKMETESTQETKRAPKTPTSSQKRETKATRKSEPTPSKAAEEAKPQKPSIKEKRREVKESEQIAEKTPSPLSRLAESLGAPSLPEKTPEPPSIEEVADALSNRRFKALYKDEFDRFTPEQKRFIKDNLSRIQAITQHYLTTRGYPYVAARFGRDGMNIVEFYLHPNGDISGLKVIEGAGFEELDKNSLDTIKTAYKDYPRPKETTKIRFYIYYRLY